MAKNNEQVIMDEHGAVITEAAQSTELASTNVRDAKNSGIMASSIPNDTFENKRKIYNALQNADEGVGDMIGETILLKDFICQPVSLKNDKTGEYEERVRTILIDADGKSYGCASSGIYNALVAIVDTFTDAEDWPLPVVFKQFNDKKGQRVYTLQVA